MLQWGLFHHGFGGAGQESRFSEGQRQHGQRDQRHSTAPDSRACEQQAANNKAAQSHPQTESQAATSDPVADRPLQQNQQSQLQGDHSAGSGFAQSRSGETSAHQIKGQSALSQGDHPRGHDADGQHRQKRGEPAPPFRRRFTTAWLMIVIIQL